MVNNIYKVRFTKEAGNDIKDIFKYILEKDEKATAKRISQDIRKQGEEQLKTLPYRGKVVPELETMTKLYRQIYVAPYRIIYRIFEDRKVVRILVVAHTRRKAENMLDRLIHN